MEPSPLSDLLSALRDVAFFAAIVTLGYASRIQESSIVILLGAYANWRFSVAYVRQHALSMGGGGGPGGTGTSGARFAALSSVPIRTDDREPIIPPPPKAKRASIVESIVDRARVHYARFAPAIWIALGALAFVVAIEARAAHVASKVQQTSHAEVKR